MDEIGFRLERLFKLGDYKNFKVVIDDTTINMSREEFYNFALEGVLKIFTTIYLHNAVAGRILDNETMRDSALQALETIEEIRENMSIVITEEEEEIE